MKRPSIMLDAGHGGQDPGALGTKLREKDVALTVAMLIGAQLIGLGIDVRYTRKDDTFIPLARRAEMANEAGVDLFLSIHCNSSNKPARGFEVFTTPGQTKADPFATELFKAFASEFPTLPKRMDTSDGDPDKEASFAVLRLSDMPAALFELDFIHDPGGEEFLGDAVFQGRMAKALAGGVYRTLFPIGAGIPLTPPAVQEPATVTQGEAGSMGEIVGRLLAKSRSSHAEIVALIDTLNGLAVRQARELEAITADIERLRSK